VLTSQAGRAAIAEAFIHERRGASRHYLSDGRKLPIPFRDWGVQRRASAQEGGRGFRIPHDAPVKRWARIHAAARIKIPGFA
jgi:hypothetical protein